MTEIDQAAPRESRMLSVKERETLVREVVTQFEDILLPDTRVAENMYGDLTLDISETNTDWGVLLTKPTEDYPYTNLQVTNHKPSDRTLSQETVRIIIDNQEVPDFPPSIWVENILEEHLDRPIKPAFVNDSNSLKTAQTFTKSLESFLSS